MRVLVFIWFLCLVLRGQKWSFFPFFRDFWENWQKWPKNSHQKLGKPWKSCRRGEVSALTGIIGPEKMGKCRIREKGHFGGGGQKTQKNAPNSPPSGKNSTFKRRRSPFLPYVSC